MTLRANGVELAVKVTPKGGRDGVDGIYADAAGVTWLAVRLRVAPEAGKANADLYALLARWLGVAPSAVAVATGAKGRWKRLRVAGEPAALAARVAALTGTESPAPR